mgnify:CR=1 FL=1
MEWISANENEKKMSQVGMKNVGGAKQLEHE